MASTYPYPFDNTGTLPSNKITGEKHVLSFYSNDTKTIIPVFAPFFRNSLRVYHEPSGQYLTEGMDFYLGHIFESAQMEQRYSVYGSISFIDIEMQGNVVLEYQTIGGPYTVPFEEILIYLNKPFERPQSRVWKEVMKYPRDVVPMDPINSLPEAIERDPVTRALNQIQLKLREYYEDTQDKLDAIFIELERVETEIVDWGFPTHDHENGLAHSVTPAQSGALALRATAKDALKAYNMTLAQLVSYIHDININQDKLDEYLPLAGGTMRGRIMFANDKAIVKNANSTTTIDLRSGSVKISTKGDVQLTANADKSSDEAALLRAGLNRLVAGSKGGTIDNNTLAFNGYMVLHAGNIGEFIPKLEESKLPLSTEVSEYVMLRGAGRGEDAVPLDGVVTFPRGTAVKEGVIILSHHPATDNDLIVPSMVAIYTLKVTADGKLDDTHTINGKRLTNDITIDAGDLGLGRVNNTSPENKPASDDYTAAAAGKALDGHTHPISDFDGWVDAAVDVYGFFRLSSDITSNSTDHAATPDAAYKLDTVIKTIENEASKYIPANALDVTAYGGTSGLPISASGSFTNNGYAETSMGVMPMLFDGGYLKYIRNGASYGERPRTYYGYSRLDINNKFEDFVNTTVGYEPAYAGAGRAIEYVTSSRDGYMAAISADAIDGSNPTVHLVQMNGKIESAYHKAITTDLPLPASYKLYDLFLSNNYLYVMNYDNSITQFTLFRTAVTNFEGEGNVVMEKVLMDYDFIGGTSGPSEIIKLASMAATTGVLRCVRPAVNDTWSGLSNIHANGVYRLIYSDGDKVYLYVGYKANYYHAGRGNRWVEWHATYVMDTTTRTCRLLGGWPASEDVIPEVYHDGTYVDHGSPDHRTTQVTKSSVAQHDFRGCGQFIGKYEVAIAGIGRAYNAMTVDSIGESPLDRVDFTKRQPTSTPQTNFNVTAGGAIKNRSHSFKVGLAPENGDGADVLCLMGRTGNGGNEYFAIPFDVANQNDDWDNNVYAYPKSWAIDGAVWSRVNSIAYNQKTNQEMPAFMGNATTHAELALTLDYNGKIPDEAWGLDEGLMALQKDIRCTLVEYVGTNTAKWNAYITQTVLGRVDADTKRLMYVAYRANVTNVGGQLTVTKVEAFHAPITMVNSAVLTMTVSQGSLVQPQIGYLGDVYGMSIPLTAWATGSTVSYRVQCHCINYDATTGFAATINQTYQGSVNGTASNSIVTLGKHYCSANHDATYTGVVGTAYELGLQTSKTNRIIVLAAVKDNWTVYFTTEQEYYASQEEYVIAPDNFDLTVLYPSTHKNNIFYFYANVINDTAVYEISNVLEEDYGARSYIGYVATGESGIRELDIRPLLRLGRVQELIDHIANPIAHTGSELGGDAIGLGKVQNLPITHDFDPAIEPSPLEYISESAVLDFKVEMQTRLNVVKGARTLTAGGGINIMPGGLYTEAHRTLSCLTSVRYNTPPSRFYYLPYKNSSENWFSGFELVGGDGVITAPIADGAWIRDGKAK